MKYSGVGINWFDWLLLVLAVAAVALALYVLGRAVYQYYLDNWNDWPYVVEPRGRLQDTFADWNIVLEFWFRNPTTVDAFFEVRYTPEKDTRRFIPAHVSIWPSQEKMGYYIVIPAGTSRVVRVQPFATRVGGIPSEWRLTVVEFWHREKPVVLAWPKDLDKPVGLLASEIPAPKA